MTASDCDTNNLTEKVSSDCSPNISKNLPNSLNKSVISNSSNSASTATHLLSPQRSSPSESEAVADLTFHSKGLHIANLNVRHLFLKLDEIQIMLASENGPDILGMCETFLDQNIGDSLISIPEFEFLRKDRCCTVNKAGGGVILYFRNSIDCRRRHELEISNIETLWTEINFPNSRPFL